MGFVHSKSVLTLAVTSASGVSHASNVISIWTFCGPAPANSGRLAEGAPRACGRFQVADFEVVISAGLYMKTSLVVAGSPSTTVSNAFLSWPPVSISA